MGRWTTNFWNVVSGGGIGMNFKDQFGVNSEVKVTTKNITPTIIDIQGSNEVVIDISGEVINLGVSVGG